MQVNFSEARKCLKEFDFQTLFREHLGWDNCGTRVDVNADGSSLTLEGVAQKRGFVAFKCPSIPDRATRLKIDHQVARSAREHLIIYSDKLQGLQIWQWVRREPGKPMENRERRFEVQQSGDPLIQRLEHIAVSLEEEEDITVVDVVGRACAAFDVDRVTKRFYDRFKAEHSAFLKMVSGIDSEPDMQWYTSLMLNRLMFVYFIQKKGFLDGDADYLKNRLAMVQREGGKDKFHTFYRFFLLRLFHDGLGKSPEQRDLEPALQNLLGRVPFLNGGFFEVHQLEDKYSGIDIPDKAFEKLFDFFDQYSWHLDERPLREDNEINPDVVGYIFEKYINQKQMGAYYTKEDITEYIGKNTIIPFLFGAAEKECAVAFGPESALWRLLQDNPDKYIYSAVQHGVVLSDGEILPESELPDFVQTGMYDPRARMHNSQYNLQQAPADDPIRLVTETWREYAARRTRYMEVRARLQQGDIHRIDDLITLNLDIWQFARDAIVNAEGPELLRAFWHAINSVTVLDPTCGSGAFLFAALRIFETLYSDCLERMKRFLEDVTGKPHHPKQFSDFRSVLDQISKHPNERYFILKSVIINNLFGVDIMEEAVEICKLRLFLKLVAQVEKAEQIEPLPDIDFNIRAGNTLVGYATADHVRKAFKEERSPGGLSQNKLMLGDSEEDYRKFEESLGEVERLFRAFREQQTTHGGVVTHDDKLEIRRRLSGLSGGMDLFLAKEYGIDVEKRKDFEAWYASHRPFHWFVEFYGIMQSGGFDVIIGNPPYVELSSVAGQYNIQKYSVISAGNLYAVCIERFMQLFGDSAKVGVIVPISAISTPRMLPLMRLLLSLSMLHVSSFAVRPGKLFTGVDMNLVICLASAAMRHSVSPKVFSTGYNRWNENSRICLFPTLSYEATNFDEAAAAIPKLGGRLERLVLQKMKAYPQFKDMQKKESTKIVFYHSGGRYFRKCIREKLSNEYKELVVRKDAEGAMICLLSSSLYYWFWIAFSDCYHVTKGDIAVVPVQISLIEDESLFGHANRLIADLDRNAKIRIRLRADGTKQREVNFYVGKSKQILDEIDRVLAEHYGFTDEELDFIINYDIKYRMGNSNGEEEDD